MRAIVPLLMWVLVSVAMTAIAALMFYVNLPAFAVVSGFLAVLLWLWTHDEYHLYRSERASAVKHEPLTKLPNFPAQTKRPLR